MSNIIKVRMADSFPKAKEMLDADLDLAVVVIVPGPGGLLVAAANTIAELQGRLGVFGGCVLLDGVTQVEPKTNLYYKVPHYTSPETFVQLLRDLSNDPHSPISFVE